MTGNKKTNERNDIIMLAGLSLVLVSMLIVMELIELPINHWVLFGIGGTICLWMVGTTDVLDRLYDKVDKD